ncbi:MAG: DUF2298 domain-containing protein [Saccharofermentanales bacterium]
MTNSAVPASVKTKSAGMAIADQLKSWPFWILPVVAVALSFRYLGTDAPAFTTWYLTFFLSSFAFLPLSSLIFAKNSDRGYAFAKPLSMAITGFVIWTLSYLRIVPFRFIAILTVLVLFFALFLSQRKTREAFADTFRNAGTIRMMAIEEAIFAGGLLFWAFVRGIKPLLDSLEKPMDYGFMMSMMRTDFLPAKDMWFSSGNINYYYFGQYIYTFMTKLSGLHPDVTYNLSMAATFALTLSLSFALCYMLLETGMKKGLRLFAAAPALGGAIGAFFVTIGGNSHAFFYGSHYNSATQSIIRAPGYKILQFLSDKGLLAKWQPAAEDLIGKSETNGIVIDSFWFANSTRFIGYNPTTHDKTIHEFPYYSFLVADLHAHLINLSFVLLLIALMAVLVNSPAMYRIGASFRRTELLLSGTEDKGWFRKEVRTTSGAFLSTVSNPIFLISSLLLGIFMMCNFWDFAIYLVVISMTLLIVNLKGIGKLGSWETLPVFLFQMVSVMVPFLFISNPAVGIAGFAGSVAVCFLLLLLASDAFTITGAQISLLFFISHLLVLPFNLNFEPISKSIALSINHTPLYQLAVLWCTHIFIGLLFVVFVVRRRIAEKTDIPGHAVYARGRVSRFLTGMNPMDLFVAGLFICGLMFVVMPELVYVVDIYSGDYKRANTMFKFTYQAFVMLSLVLGYCVMRIALTKPGPSKVDYRWSFVSILMILLLAVPAYYPTVATGQWIGEIKPDKYIGLNGIEGLGNADRLDAIHWINDNIEGQPVLLESYGDSYSEYYQLTAYTGLRTVIGWQTHEWLWRSSKTVTDGYNQIVRPHQTDVQTIYEFKDEASVNRLILQYSIEYIAVGQVERSKFASINEEMLKTLGSIVFENDGLYIIKVNPLRQ